ncbi:MAG: primosome assembly protein PriA [Aeromicrobium sp.]|uniref:primosomal protein N' family DNA-binding protein n=1 Tax=Aeromicrobium sp. TaxID=1871063 RepID=UPI0039E2F4EF
MDVEVEFPVARVVVDTPLSHLDRLFDYAVPADLDDQVVPGSRVKVRFAGRLVAGFCVARVAASDHEGQLAPVAKAVSAEPVLSPQVFALARAVADRYAGTLSDILRLAVPPRQARVESAPVAARARGALAPQGEKEFSVPEVRACEPRRDTIASAWTDHPDAPGFLAALADGRPARAVWSALPPHDPARAVAQAVLAGLRAGRGAVVCVPDVRDVAHWDQTFTEVLGEGRHVTLTGQQKPSARYRSFLALSRGQVQVVLGTRSAAFAPVRDLGLVAIWDDGDDLYADPHAPYPHAREVLLTRAHLEQTALLLGGYARTAEAQALLASGWARPLEPDTLTRREAWPRVAVVDPAADLGTPIRLPRTVVNAIRKADGPVLVQVPRRGYRPSLSCQGCRAKARCRACEGPLAQGASSGPLICRLCGEGVPRWVCPECGDARLRSGVIGHVRTAEEFARAFPDREVITSGGDHVRDLVDGDRALVLATPGGEPRVSGGYALVVLLDTGLMLARDDLRVIEEAHRRWFNAIASGRSVVAVGEAGLLQWLVRADPAGAARTQLAERSETKMPPVGRLVTVDGAPADLAVWATRPWTPATEVLGPVPLDADTERLVLRCPRAEGLTLARLLKVAQGERSAARLVPLRVRVDPPSF